MKASLDRQGLPVSRKRVQRLMRIMGLRAIYRQPRTSQPTPERLVYPYLLRDLTITRANQVWAADITYLPMARGFLYLVAIMDWHSRYVMAWGLSNTLETGFCAEALTEALGQGRPDVFNTDQGSQFTSREFMEDVLDLYAEPYDPQRPVVCFDETSTQLLADTREPLPAKPGRPRREDYEYQRAGTRNLFLTCEPRRGWRHVAITRQRTMQDFAHQMRWMRPTPMSR